MKKLLTLFSLLAMFAFAACEENGGDINPNDPTPENIFFGLDKETVSISPDGGSVYVIVYSNYKWEISGTSDWCTPSATSGEANEDGQIVYFSADVTYDNREATFWFHCADEKIKFTASQSFKEAIITDENNTFSVPAEGGNVILDYQTTVECEVIIPEEAQGWISLASGQTKGLVSGSATLNIALNNKGVERSAVIKVVKDGDHGGLYAEYTITQERNMDYVILYTTTDGNTVSPNSFYYLANTYEDGVGMLAFDGSNVTSIGWSAFQGCTSLTSITIPDSVTSLGKGAFAGCTSLTSITIPDSVTSIGEKAFSGCTGELILNCSCLGLYGGQFTKVVIGDSVTSIGGSAFENCTSLTSITIPDSVTSIGRMAFYKCKSLTSVTIGDSVTSIGDWAFFGCTSLTSVTIPDSVTSIGNSAFYDCSKLTIVSIGDSVTSIGEEAFWFCTSLTSITIPDSVTSIGEWAFYDCTSLTSITIPDSVTSIGRFAFAGCTGELILNCSCLGLYGGQFTRLVIGDSVTSIGDYAFYGCSSLTNITIGNGVTSIGEEAFRDCTSLTSITIPDSVTEIGCYAFYGCKSLKSVYCKPTTPPTGGGFDMFYDNASGRKIYVPTASVDAYKAASYWSNYKAYIEGYDF